MGEENCTTFEIIKCNFLNLISRVIGCIAFLFFQNTLKGSLGSPTRVQVVLC